MPSTLATAVHSELLIRKSRFIGCVEPVADRPAALLRVAALRTLHPGAAHVCWALLAGGASAAVDDGEPGGTAGRPMLEVLRHQDLDGVLATVVRYFGGVKLGAGGLVRAYTDAVAQALLGADKRPLQRLQTLRCVLPYALEGWLRRELGAGTLQVSHGMHVELQFSLPEGDAAALRRRLDDGGQGRLVWVAPSD
ncbi:MAG: YigZ family protein [Methylibium sp.]